MTTARHSSGKLGDAMRERTLSARWCIQGRLELKTAAHFGGDALNAPVDAVLLRDTRTERPLLPGTSLAGLLRGALTDRLQGYDTCEEAEVIARLFGGSRGADEGSQSPLIVFDALGTLPEAQSVELRDGVAIDASVGTAEDHKKYDYEVLPAGTTFALRLDLLVPNPDSEPALLSLLVATLEAISHASEYALGARRSRGLGAFEVVWSARRFDLTTPQGWISWAESPHEPAPLTRREAGDEIKKAISKQAFTLDEMRDVRRRASITLSLTPQHDVLVRHAATRPEDPDVVHLTSGGRSILPGTSLAGVMRAQALRIAKLVHGEQDGPQRVEQIFGPRLEGRTSSASLRASRLRVGEGSFTTRKLDVQQRIAIDRFTHAVAEGALFDEAPQVGGEVSITLELRNPAPGELGLILLVIKDMLTGKLAVGGTSNVGRGFMNGHAVLHWRENEDHAEYELRPDRRPDSFIEEQIRLFASSSLAQGARS